MKNAKDLTKRRSNPQFKSMVMRWLVRLAENSHSELTKLQVENFYDELASWTDFQINTAFTRCRRECVFFPTVKEVLDRMPEERAYRGPIVTCALCEPDGWRLVTTEAPYRGVVRCDHSPANAPNPPAEHLKKLYENPPAWVSQKTKTPPNPPRFPHLLGKGIVFSGEKS